MPCPPGDSGISPGPGGPKAGAFMAVVRESVMAERGGCEGPAFVGGVLGPGHLCQDVAVLLVSDLSGNSVQRGGRTVTWLELWRG